jgi:TPR repeat protein
MVYYVGMETDSHITAAAEREDPFAMFELAVAYDYGTGVQQDFRVSSSLYLKAWSLGHQSAGFNLLLQHVFGQADNLAADKVFEELLSLASSGDRDAQNNVGLCYQHGYGVAQNYKMAASWFRRAAKAGLDTAQFNLGGFYLEAKGMRKNLKKAIACYKRAAEQRHELALLQLGNLYQKGIGVAQDYQRAFILYICAYRQGSVRAANHLAHLYKKGLGVERNDTKAHELFLESVRGYDSPCTTEELSYRKSAYYWLGFMSEKGEGTPLDPDAALDWYRKGAALSEPSCVSALARIVPGKRSRCKPSTNR